MGRSGSKGRKTGKKPQHLPKVGTPQERHYELEHEQRAVIGNLGIHRKGAGYWIAAILVILIVAGGLIAWIFVT